jgi:MoaA/NifB/PqqE/SkfB family radical SAM enzyme/SAM-dependent methyltransferase
MTGQEFFLRIAKRPPFSKLHPRVAEFFKQYLVGEKAVRFDGRLVVNTQFPPFPSRAFDNMAEHFLSGDIRSRRLYSVTWAVTNRCGFRCWHCYNAGRSTRDVPLSRMRELAGELQDLGAVMVTFTGGEPLLRRDLEQVAAALDDRSCLILGTTGDALTGARAADLRKAGLFAVGVSLDSAEEAEHDRLRGRRGAFRIAMEALRTARSAGLYPYVVSVGTREFLEPDRFFAFLDFVRAAGAMEVHLLEPSATGRLAGRRDMLLSPALRRRIVDYQKTVAAREDLPVLSTYTYLESPCAFGCGAGLTHLYIDGSGEVCPCNLVPLSFGNVAREPLRDILARMKTHFDTPRPGCVGRLLNPHVPPGAMPTDPATSQAICRRFLPRRHSLPRFFRVRKESQDQAGRKELKAAYDRVHGQYDEFWVSQAGKPVVRLIRRLHLRGDERVFEAGCGSGWGTALLARALRQGGTVLAADLSAGMLREARRRLRAEGIGNVRLVAGDALKVMDLGERFDLVFSSWVLGYIPVRPFFAAASRVLAEGGRLAFVVHRDNSPQEATEIFSQLVARDPSVLRRRVAFDFPKGADHVRRELAAEGLAPVDVWEGRVIFRYPTAGGALEHLLKSGAGTVFYDAIDPVRRQEMERGFVEELESRHARRKAGAGFTVIHDYVACIARRP